MPRIRTIKPEFFSSESMGRLSRDARLLAVGLVSQSDDEGRFRAHPRLLAAAIFPYDDDASGELAGWLHQVEAEGFIQLYSVRGDSYGCIPHWKDHQKIEKPSRSKLPPPPLLDDSKPPRRQLDDVSPTSTHTFGEESGSAPQPVDEESGGEGIREGNGSSFGEPPDFFEAGGGKASSGGAGGNLPPLPAKMPRTRAQRAKADETPPAPRRLVSIRTPPPPEVYPPLTHDELELSKPAVEPIAPPPLARPGPVVLELARVLWNEAALETPLKRWDKGTEAQWRKLKAIGVPPAEWSAVCHVVARNRYLRGEKGKHPPVGPDWLLNRKNFAAVQAGEYEADVPAAEPEPPRWRCGLCGCGSEASRGWAGCGVEGIELCYARCQGALMRAISGGLELSGVAAWIAENRTDPDLPAAVRA